MVPMSEIPDRPARPWDMFNKNIKKVETELAEKRMEICRACPELIKLTEQCKKCGCFMAAKTKLPHAECPLGKWNKVTVSYTEEM